VVVAIPLFLLAQGRRESWFWQFVLEAGTGERFAADTFQSGTKIVVKSL